MGGVRVDQSDDMPGCMRCGEETALRAMVPIGGASVNVELCLSCDAGPTAAGRLVEHFLLPAEEKSAAVMAELIKAWMLEAMAARGFGYMARPEPPREGLLEDGRSAAVVAAARIGAQRDRRASLN